MAECNAVFIDVPDPIETLSIVARRSGRSESFLLRWQVPDCNGLEITGYQISATRWPGLPTLSTAGGNLEKSEECRKLETDEISVEECSEAVEREDARNTGFCEYEFTLTDAIWRPAVWLCVRSRNAEGWAEWSKPTFAFIASPKCDGTLYIWGAPDDGRLGLGPAVVAKGKASAEALQVPVINEKVVSVVSLGAHSAAITTDNELFVWGSFGAEIQGPAGLTDEVCMLDVPTLQPLPCVPHSVTCGRYNTAVVSVEGKLFTWGPNDYHQCGLKEPTTVDVVMAVPIPAPVVEVSLGEFHGLCRTSEGQVLSWGHEQGPNVPVPLPLSEPACAALPQAVPRPIEISQPVRAVKVAAGAFHSALITDEGKLWTWGQNDHLQLGHGTAPCDIPFGTALPPRQLKLESRVSDVSLGGYHSAAIDVSGSAFTWGSNAKGQCGQGDTECLSEPTSLTLSTKDLQCVNVNCGGLFTVFQAQTQDSEAPVFLACGQGKDGCLGFGVACKPVRRPRQLIAAPAGGRWSQIFTGSVHSAGLWVQEDAKPAPLALAS